MSKDVESIKRVEKPWGYELWWAVTESYLGKILHVGAGHSLSYQYHNEKDETLYLLSGKVEMEVKEKDGESEKLTLLPGESLRIPPLTRHRITALVDSDIVEVSTAHPDDVVRLKDDYGRV